MQVYAFYEKSRFNLQFKCKMVVHFVIRSHLLSQLSCRDSQNVKVSEAIFQKKQNPEVKYLFFVVMNFREREEEEDEKTKKLRWMHLQQQKQSLSWAEGDEEVGGVGLKIIVLENMFSLDEAKSWCSESN